MAFTPGSLWRVLWSFELGPYRASCTRIVRCTGVTNGGPADGVVAKRFYDVYLPKWQPLLTSSAAIQGTILSGPLPGNDTPIAAWPGIPDPGTGGTAPLPPQTSGLLILRPSAGSRSCWGTMYPPFPDQSHNGPGPSPNAVYDGQLSLLATQLLATVTASDTMPVPPFSPRTASFRSVLMYTPSGSNIVVGTIERSPRWATQRRRASNPPRYASVFG